MKFKKFLLFNFLLILFGVFISAKAITLPKPLKESDLETYKKIFDLQEKGYIKKADILINNLDNKILLGNILSQRYLHPTAYISKFSELKSWLETYSDHPSASRIYWLSKRKKPKSVNPAIKPSGGFLSGFGGSIENNIRPKIPRTFKGRSAPKITRNIAYKIRKYIRRGWPSGALEVLKTKEAIKFLTKKEQAQLYWEISNAYFIFNKDFKAISESSKALILSKGLQSNAWFTAGLANWRRGDIRRAKIFFENLANLKTAPGSIRAAGAYWASRVALRELKPENAIMFLQIAALEKNSFYGQLALSSLGIYNKISFELPNISKEFILWLNSTSGGKRTFALLQLNLHWMADRELRRLYNKIPEKFSLDLISFSSKFQLSSLAYRLADLERKKSGIEWYGALYPDLDFDLENDIDKALIHSIIRQESRFDQRGKSSAKAQGLMQILPSTASFVTKDKGYRGKTKYKLLQKNVNISIGSSYINQLLQENIISNNFIYLLAAYNGGPGNLNKWKKKLKYDNDYLLLIESIPSRETRWYIKSVLKNLYVYRAKYSQEKFEFDKLSSGYKPLYVFNDFYMEK